MDDISFDHSAPLRGIVICCTLIPDEKRTAIALYAEQMGARHHLDLTRDVTHLIIGCHESLKYKYVARNRQDVKPMSEAWIEAIRELWIADEEINLVALEKKFTLPTFHSLKFSMTGCEELTERQEIAELVKANGAIYEGDLTRSITHLIALRTDGAKYKAAKSWGLKIVSIEWLYQSLERGMILEETLFDPTIPKEDRGRGAWQRDTISKLNLGKRPKAEKPTSTEDRKRKLRKTASLKLSGQQDRIWADISGNSTTPDLHKSRERKINGHEKSFQNEKSKVHDQPTIKTSNYSSGAEYQSKITGIFFGCMFWLHDFSTTKMEILQNHIVSNGGKVLPNSDNSSTLPSFLPKELLSNRIFMIVPHDLPKANLPVLPLSYPVELVTVWWIERCLHHKQFLEPKEHIIGQPFPVFPIPELEAKKMVFCSSAFSGIDLLHLMRAIELIGGTYDDFMTPKASMLIAKSEDTVRKDKINYALEWKIPIVTANWLWDSIETGMSLPTQAYTFQPKLMLTTTLTVQEPKTTLTLQKENSSNLVFRSSGISTDCNPGLLKQPNVQSNHSHKAEESVKTVTDNRKKSSSISLRQPKSSDMTLLHTKLQVEKEANSPSHTMTTENFPSEKSKISYPRPSEDFSNAISSLLAKTKGTASNQSTDRTEIRKRSRILGRVASNTSNQSRATSVDSTATHGHPVQWLSNSLDKTANERIELLINGDKSWKSEFDDNQLPITQLEYDDPDSTIAREVIMARMRGEVIDLEKVEKIGSNQTDRAFKSPQKKISKDRKRGKVAIV